MDVTINPEYNIYVNNKISSLDTLVYENFNVIWTLEKLNLSDVTDTDFENEEIEFSKYLTKATEIEEIISEEDNSELNNESEIANNSEIAADNSELPDDNEEKDGGEDMENEKYMTVFVNGEEIHLKGKDEYILVDVFDYIDFNLSKPEGRSVATKVNGQSALFAQTLNPLDKLEIYWEK